MAAVYIISITVHSALEFFACRSIKADKIKFTHSNELLTLTV